MKKFILIMLFFSLSIFIVSCSDDKDDDNGNGNGNETPAEFKEETAKSTVKAAEGGTVKTETDSASVEIPTGALEGDTEITISSVDKKGQPDEANLGSFVYDFGPDGTQFKTPVTIAIKLGMNVPSEKQAAIHVLEGGAWKKVASGDPRMLKAGEKISAEVMHFSKYVIRFTDKDITMETENCGASFTACGGDLTGKWGVAGLCMEGEMGAPGDFPEECKDTMEMTYEMNWNDAYIEFKSGGTYIADMDANVTKMETIYQDACLSALGQGAEPSEVCGYINEGNEEATCVYGSGKCTCSASVSDSGENEEPENGTYTTSGNEFTITTPDSEGGEDDVTTGEYCVSGDMLTVKVVDTDDKSGETREMYYTFKKP